MYVVPFYYLWPNEYCFHFFRFKVMCYGVQCFAKSSSGGSIGAAPAKHSISDLVMLKLQQLCEAVRKRAAVGWKRGKQIRGGQFWPVQITNRIHHYPDPCLHSERQEA